MLRFLLAPGSLQLLIVMVALGLIPTWRGGYLARVARVWIAAWCLVYVALSIPVVAIQLARGLTDQYEPLTSREQARGSDTIVVLAGGASHYQFPHERRALGNVATTLRALEAARLYRLLGTPHVVISGTGSRALGSRSPQAESMRDVLLAEGVPEERISLEMHSLDTHESAVVVEGMLRTSPSKAIVLVTSGHHLPRAIRAFRTVGFEVIPSPAPVLASGGLNYRAFVPQTSGLALSAASLHEYLGILYYAIRGWA